MLRMIPLVVLALTLLAPAQPILVRTEEVPVGKFAILRHVAPDASPEWRAMVGKVFQRENARFLRVVAGQGVRPGGPNGNVTPECVAGKGSLWEVPPEGYKFTLEQP